MSTRQVIGVVTGVTGIVISMGHLVLIYQSDETISRHGNMGSDRLRSGSSGHHHPYYRKA